MAKTYPDIEASQAWVDITTLPSHAALRNKNVLIQAKSGRFNYIAFGGSVAPQPRDGLFLPAPQSYTGTADHIWVRGDGRFALSEED